MSMIVGLRRIRRIGASLVLLAACSGSEPAAPLPCPRALDDYCVNASPPCARHLTPSNPTGSFCEQCGGGCALSLQNCSGGTGSHVPETSSHASARVSRRGELYGAPNPPPHPGL